MNDKYCIAAKREYFTNFSKIHVDICAILYFHERE